jgi:hypothetical protein
MVRGGCTASPVVPRFPSVVLPCLPPGLFHPPSARNGPLLLGASSRGPRVALVPQYAVWDLRPADSPFSLSLSLSLSLCLSVCLSGGETEHDATAALITLVATHMLNVHPVMPAATAAVIGKGDVVGIRPTHVVGACVCARAYVERASSRVCDADQAHVCRTSDSPASGACVYANVKREWR